MKKITFLSVLTLIICSCGISTVSGILNNHKIKGNGIKVTQNRDISSFNAIKLSGIANIEVVSGPAFSLTISGDENIVKLITTEVRSNRLEVGTSRSDFDGKENVMIKVTTSEPIEMLDVSGMGHINVSSAVSSSSFKIEASGMAHIDVKSVDTKSVVLDVSGMGKVECQGKATNLTVNNSGMGKINTNNLKAENVSCDNSGMGKIQLYAGQSLKVDVSGMGEVIYSGNPTKVSPSVSGMGKLDSAN